MTVVPNFFVSPPVIVSPRLRFRAPRVEDAAAIFEYASRENVTRYVLFPTHRSITDAEEFISKIRHQVNAEFGTVWIIALRESQTVIGSIGLHKLDVEHGTVEVGYVLHDDYWGNGYTTEALRSVIAEVFTQTPLERIEALCHVDNIGSARVMEKSGMTYEGTLRSYKVMKPGRSDMDIYSILRDEFERRNRR